MRDRRGTSRCRRALRSRAAILAPAFVILAAVLAGASASSAAKRGASVKGAPAAPYAPSLIDNDDRMDINNLDMVVTNHGSFAYDLLTGNAGLVFPKGSTNTCVFAAGVWIGARVAGVPRLAIGEYSQEFVPGPMAGGTYQSDRPEFRNYRIERGGAGYADYLAFAVPQGAPVNAVGDPLLLGDATIWSVYNDADPGAHTNSAGLTPPLGVEVQQTTFAFNRSGPLGNTIFVKLKLLNRGFNMLEDAYVSLWSDPDVGGFTDDLAGCDTTLGLGYAYNATNADAQYGATPPAVGLMLLQGPAVPSGGGVLDTLGMTAFGSYVNGTDPVSSFESYNAMRGLNTDGTPMHVQDNPGLPVTTFRVSGDPVTGTGWLDSPPADKRILLTSGPFAMAPGESLEIVAAIIVGWSTDRLASITDLRSLAAAVGAIYASGFLVPSLLAPAARTVDEGQRLAFDVTLEGTSAPATLAMSGGPIGATFLDRGDGTGTFDWTPDFSQAGAYLITFTAQLEGGGTLQAATNVTVHNVNRKPVARPGGPYTAFAEAPITLDGSASSDPDGDPITFAWNFGDGMTGTGATPMHTYRLGGTYGVALTVSDGVLSDVATTTVTVVDIFAARAFTSSGNRSVRLSAGKPIWCAQVEPVGRSFDVALVVDLSTVVMKSDGTGSVSEIHAISEKSSAGSDRDGNSLAEVTLCFRKEDLRLLFGNMQGHVSVPVILEGSIVTGGQFRAPLDVGVIGGSGGALSARLFPNPLRADGLLTFRARRSGPLRVRIFDAAGRQVRELVREPSAAAGYHEIPFERVDRNGHALPCAIYFYRIEAGGDVQVGRFAVLR